MAKVTVRHPGMGSREAGTPPKRDPVPEGKYAALIMAASVDTANRFVPPVQKIRVEFQLLHRILDDGKVDETGSGRRVFQDFLLAPANDYPDLDQLRRFELVQLLDACHIPRDADGAFEIETNDMLQKTVFVHVKNRNGKEKDRDPDTGQLPVFSNVTRIESAEVVEAEELI